MQIFIRQSETRLSPINKRTGTIVSLYIAVGRPSVIFSKSAQRN